MPYAFHLPVSDRLVILPDRWQDVTLQQADALSAGKDIYDYLAALCGVSPEHIMQWPASVLTPGQLECLAFLGQPMPELRTLSVPKYFALPGAGPDKWVSMAVPQDISSLSFGQSVDLAAVLTDTSLSAYQQHAKVLAIYFYPLYYRCAYDSDAIEAFVDICMQATLDEALPITAFFFAQYERIRQQHARQLKKIPLRPEERAAGLDKLVAEWDTVAVVDALSGGDKTRWPYFFRLSWAEVNVMIEYENHQAHVRYRLRQQQEKQRK
ncbi:hypothetical protein MUN82_03955 [Hymenobacter aerilatus]|uniref:Uncharacterized protein n=1 Tax=Hymenobacter aerilatus TaxID=2932251 RepID=A0A8T9SZW3_9BACT|nr:hypothetical protein [Hymenobacter aerilatus]UOR06253.1 hypothetical protein MUN82_03955 [Hymenobacter aerilatus]